MAAPQAQAQPSQGVAPTSTVASARDVVSVACKLPNGIIMREFRESQEVELVLGGGTRDVTVYRPTGEQIIIGGTAARFGDPRPPLLQNGYRITRDVPASIWDPWLKANRDSDMVRNHLIYATARHDDVKAFAREHESTTTGLEGIDPENPGARVRGIARGEKPK